MAVNRYTIAVVPGDGIGIEVVPEALRALEAISAGFGFESRTVTFPYSCAHYRTHGSMMPADGLDRLRDFDAILLGAVGDPAVPDHVSLWGLLLPIRRTFEQYINLRPVRLLPGIRTPLADRTPGEIDFCIVRENTEGEYSEVGGRLFHGTPHEVVVQSAVFTRRGVDRVLHFAFNLARTRRGHVTSATKSNGIMHSMPFWDERFATVAEDYPDVTTVQYHVDILSSHFVTRPDRFDVVVASNLFGDILSDLGPAIAGGIGVAPSANLNPEREFPSMFEPVHGSAPDIAGLGIANPVATIWSIALMLDALVQRDAAATLVGALEETVARPDGRTPDIGGTATTVEVVDRVLASIHQRVH